MKILGDDWAYVVTDVTEGGPGNGERLCFIHDRRRARSSGLVGEIVLPASADGVVIGALDRQFARTPYAVSFAAGEKAFTLVTLHALYGASKADKERRRDELQAIAQWLADRADDPDAFNRNLITLGDFNIDRRDDPLWRALDVDRPRRARTSSRTRRATSPTPTAAPKHHYDQIAWFTKGEREALTLTYETRRGFVEWTDYVLTDAPTTPSARPTSPTTIRCGRSSRAADRASFRRHVCEHVFVCQPSSPPCSPALPSPSPPAVVRP